MRLSAVFGPSGHLLATVAVLCCYYPVACIAKRSAWPAHEHFRCTQACVPLDADHVGRKVPDRFLLVFGCAQPGCGASPEAWRALRWQCEPVHLPAAGTSGMDVELNGRQTEAQSPVSAAAPALSDWGSAASGWGAGPGVDEPQPYRSGSAAAFDFADLDAALDKASRPGSRSSVPTMSQHESAAAGIPSPQETAPSCAAPAGPQLPAFYLHARPEPTRGAVHWELEPEDAAHVAELLQQYKAQDGQVMTGCAGLIMTSCPVAKHPAPTPTEQLPRVSMPS